jgi:hypothetical protein
MFDLGKAVSGSFLGEESWPMVGKYIQTSTLLETLEMDRKKVHMIDRSLRH